MKANIARDLETWKATFKKELSTQLESLWTDDDIYGFAVEVPEDLNLGIISAIGRESKLARAQAGSSFWIDRRYAPVEWDYLPNGNTFSASCDQLEEIARNYHNVFISETCEYTTEGIEFRD